MPCPFFEPQRVTSLPTHANARLPLMEEYDGVCRANGAPFEPAPAHRFPCCNQGNAQTVCEHFPANASATSMRYQIIKRDPCHLEVLIIEEKHHWPQTWNRIRFEVGGEELTPALANPIVKAQLLAFCRSYLKRFPEPNEPG